MTKAWQLLGLASVPERLVRFGRLRQSMSVIVLEDDGGFHVEARCGRKMLERIDVGDDRSQLPFAIRQAQDVATNAMLSNIMKIATN